MKATRYESSDLFRRKGVIVLDGDFVRRNPDILLDAFKEIDFLPVQTVSVIIADKYEYHGYSHNFGVVKEGFVCPNYELKFLVDDDGEYYGCEVV